MSTLTTSPLGADTLSKPADPRTNLFRPGVLAFLLMHAGCVAVCFTGTTLVALVLCAACYLTRMFALTAGYHRYFAHRAYKTSRWFQFVLAWLGCMAMQKGPLWWASNHRDHHKYSDTDQDPHSPITKSFWWSHVGWIISDQSDETKWSAIRDFSRFPELRWLNALHSVPGILLAFFCFVIGGFGPALASWIGAAEQPDAVFSWTCAWSGVIVGFFWSTVLLYHSTFAVNSLCHLFGRRRYATPDRSRNNWMVALLTMGEGWHNNHHYYQSSANQGFFWWEIDVSYYIIKLLAVFGIVWDVRLPPPSKLRPQTVEIARE
jgi:stearoyl-CoA desaturase (delta-9 desaturase)